MYLILKQSTVHLLHTSTSTLNKNFKVKVMTKNVTISMYKNCFNHYTGYFYKVFNFKTIFKLKL
jgi:hypothetical protein